MADFVFDIPAFRITYPQFVDPVAFPDAVLQSYYDDATIYVSEVNSGDLNGRGRYKAITLMAAHIADLQGKILDGEVPAQIVGAGIGAVNVSLKPPPEQDEWSWWLELTGYGQQLEALLEAVGVGGFYVGGSLDRLAFRKWGSLI